MSYSPLLGSSFNRTFLRDAAHPCTFSGMCAMCTADCIGSCEIGLSAVRGMSRSAAEAVYAHFHPAPETSPEQPILE